MSKQTSGTSKVSQKPAFLFPTSASVQEKEYRQKCAEELRRLNSTIPAERLVGLQIESTSSFDELNLMDVFFFCRDPDVAPNYNDHTGYFLKVGNSTALGALPGSGYCEDAAVHGNPLFIVNNAMKHTRVRFKKTHRVEKVIGIYSSK